MARITRRRFLDDYFARSGGPSLRGTKQLERTARGFRRGEVGVVALRCCCGEEDCRGWMLVDDEPAAIAEHEADEAERRGGGGEA